MHAIASGSSIPSVNLVVIAPDKWYRKVEATTGPAIEALSQIIPAITEIVGVAENEQTARSWDEYAEAYFRGQYGHGEASTTVGRRELKALLGLESKYIPGLSFPVG